MMPHRDMFDGSSFVSFAYITPPDVIPCGVIDYSQAQPRKVRRLSQLSALSSNNSSVEGVPTVADCGRKVYVKFFDTLRKTTKIQRFCVEADAKMSFLYEMIRAWLPEVNNVVCYTTPNGIHGRQYPLIEEVLLPDADVPKHIFCQEIALSIRGDMWCWAVVNILVMKACGDFILGYIPLVVHGLFMKNREMLDEQISQMCCTSSAEVNYMRMQPLLNCFVRDGTLELVSFFGEREEGTSIFQLAVVYPALVAGDLVCVSIESRVGQRYNMQGMVKRCHNRNGIVCYDVEDVVLGYVLEGLTCVQVVPL